jgi:glycosyltransferase involved in cell wall biosynthesis
MSLRAAFAIPGDLASLTGGYAYDREVLARIDGLRHLPLPQGFPFPSLEVLAESATRLSAVRSDEILLCDGLAFGFLPEQVLKQISAPIVALVHHPLALETGLSAAVVQDLAERECKALSFARRVIVTSPITRDLLVKDYRVDVERITVALPGTQRASRARGSGGMRLHLLAVGSVVPRKGYDVLLDALEACEDLDWQLTIAGSLERAPDYAQALLTRASDRIRFAGEVKSAELEVLYDRADLFVMSSHYEGYGMVLGEAMVRGLPIVTTDGGALVETVPEHAALRVKAGDTAALAQALRRAITDRNLRRTLADASFAEGGRLPIWDETAQIIARVLKEVAP